MKSVSHVGFALFAAIGACGDGAGSSVDFSAFVPKLPLPAVRSEAALRYEAANSQSAPRAAEAPNPTTYSEALSGALALMQSGDTVRAKAMFETAVRLDAKAAQPHIELARLYISTGQRGPAVAEANKAVALAPLSSQAWNTKGRAELHRFAYDAAIEAFSRAIEIDPANVWAWNNLGYTELQLQHYDDAAAHLAEATSRPGATGYMFNNLGLALEQLDRLDEARAAFEAGGGLGSKQAHASRKRLEGVSSIALFVPKSKDDHIDLLKDSADAADPGRLYPLDEGMGDDAPDEVLVPDPAQTPVPSEPGTVEH